MALVRVKDGFKAPLKDVVYVFVFANGNRHEFKLIEEKPTGGYLMLIDNKPDKCSVARFDFLYNKCLLQEVEAPSQNMG